MRVVTLQTTSFRTILYFQGSFLPYRDVTTSFCVTLLSGEQDVTGSDSEEVKGKHTLSCYLQSCVCGNERVSFFQVRKGWEGPVSKLLICQLQSLVLQGQVLLHTNVLFYGVREYWSSNKIVTVYFVNKENKCEIKHSVLFVNRPLT